MMNILSFVQHGKFTVRSAYNALHSAYHPMPGAELIWNCWAPLASWRCCGDTRRWTGDVGMTLTLTTYASFVIRMKRPSSTSWSHARSCSKWWHIHTTLRENGHLQVGNNILDWWSIWRAQWSGSCKSGLNSLFALVASELCKERNARCFRETVTKWPDVLATIKHQV